jgi:hypothetical protein
MLGNGQCAAQALLVMHGRGCLLGVLGLYNNSKQHEGKRKSHG